MPRTSNIVAQQLKEGTNDLFQTAIAIAPTTVRELGSPKFEEEYERYRKLRQVAGDNSELQLQQKFPEEAIATFNAIGVLVDARTLILEGLKESLGLSDKLTGSMVYFFVSTAPMAVAEAILNPNSDIQIY